MRYLRTNTAVRLTVGPFFDKTDGVTPETSLTVTSCKLTLMVDDANVPTLVLDTAPTASGGANDMVHVTGDDAGFYDLELAAANVNYLGRAMLAITDAATHCPVFHEFMILPAMVYDSLVLGTDTLQSDVTQWLGTAAATPTVAGVPEVDPTHWRGTAIPAEHTAGYPIVTVKDGTGTGEINTNAGAIALVDLVTTTTTATTATNLTNLPAITAGWLTAAGIAADAITDAKVANDVTIASVTGAVGSVTGAVGSVTARVTANTDQLAGQTVTAAAGVTFPASVASPTNITAGTIATVSGNVNGNVTGTIGGFTSLAKDDIQSEAEEAIIVQLGVAGAGLTNLGGMSTTMKAQVQVEVSDEMAARGYTSTVAGRIDVALSTLATAAAQTTAQTSLTAIQTILTGITSLGNWLRRAFRKDAGTAGMATAETEINTGGTATFAGTTDSLESIRDNASAPSANDNAVAVWDKLAAAHNTAGTMGAKMNAAGAAADPLANAVPGSYLAGTAGYILGNLDDHEITFRSPVLSDQEIDIVRNADYYTADGRDLEFTITGRSYTPTSCRLTIACGSTITITGTVTESSGSGSSSFHLVFQISRATGDDLDDGTGTFDVVSILANGHENVEIAEGKATIRRRLA